jgi:hypothetical protein
MALDAFLFEARVTAVFPEERVINATWLKADDHQIFNANVIMSPGNFSFPQKGDIVLVIGGPSGYYCIGKIDNQYKIKIGEGQPDEKGNPAVVKLGDGTEIGDTLKAKKVHGGETVLGNLAKGIWLSLSNSRNFSLLGGVNEGIKYIYNAGQATIRTLQLLGQTIIHDASGQITTLGAVMRFFPGVGNFIAKNPQTQQGAVEATTTIYDTVTAIAKATFKLGDIFANEPIPSQDAGILQPHTEIGATGASTWLNAVLAVMNAAGLEVASIKIDNMGNISINTPAPGSGLLSITALTKIAIDSILVHLGTTQDVPATEPVVLGTQLMTWLAGHTHGSSVGPTSPPIASDLATITAGTLISKKVFST